jgi:ribosomal protein S4
MIAIDRKGLKIKEVKLALAEKGRKLPGWLGRRAAVGKIERWPEREELELEIEESLVVEFYSR